MTLNRLALMLFGGILLSFAVGYTASPKYSDKHAVILDSVEVTGGESFVMGISVIADQIDPKEDSDKKGAGSFCIPLKYDKEAFVADSVVFMNTLSAWDEKFTNPKLDTGFVSLAGIYDMGGRDNPTLYNPGTPERIAEIFFTTVKKAKKGTYAIELTRDPRQNEIYLGSSMGVMSVIPRFEKGIVVIK